MFFGHAPFKRVYPVDGGGEGGGARSLLKKIKVVNGQCVHLHIFVSNTVGVLKMKTCREIKK